MNEKQNKETLPGVTDKKEVTPQQMQKRRKAIVFPLFFLVFAGCMWLIFAPDETTEQEQKAGFNTDLPTPESSGIVSDKRDAYIQEEMKAKQEAKMRSLQDFAFSLDEDESPEQREAREERELRMSPKPTEYYQDPSRFEQPNAFESSANAYADVNRQLGSFYEEPQTQVGAQDTELQSRIEQLEARLQQEQEQKNAEEEQLALIEKSYQMAAKYMNPGQSADGDPQPAVAATATTATSGKNPVQPVAQVRRDVVSLLAAPMSDSVFRGEFVKPRNWGFNTAAGNENMTIKNSIGACIYRTVTVRDGGEVALRLSEPMMAGSYQIPANTVVTGSARISGERMGITISAIQHGGNVIPVELLVYDMDGGEGICVPASAEINAVKEIAANMGSGMGSSITITDDAGSQLLSDLGRSAIQGISQYVSQKMREVKVTLKAGYKVLLLPPLK